MSNPCESDRIAHRSLRSVRRSKTPIGQEESVGKIRRSRHQLGLDRLRAEYKIRKAWRWVTKAVEFVPSAVLGWLKTVRACFNLKFSRGPEDPTTKPLGKSGLWWPGSQGDTGETLSSRIRSTILPFETVNPFPYWWAWWSEKTNGELILRTGSFSQSVPFIVLNGERGPGDTPWERPEALGGPHLDTEKSDLLGDTRLRRRKFVLELGVGPFEPRLFRSHGTFSVGVSEAMARDRGSSTDYYEHWPGFEASNITHDPLEMFAAANSFSEIDEPEEEASSEEGDMIIEDVDEDPTWVTSYTHFSLPSGPAPLDSQGRAKRWRLPEGEWVTDSSIDSDEEPSPSFARPSGRLSPD